MKSIEDYLSDGLKVTIHNLRKIRNKKCWTRPGKYYLEDPYKYLQDVNWCCLRIVEEAERLQDDMFNDNASM